MVDHDLAAALERLPALMPEEAVVAVPETDGAPIGWWVEGLGRRATLSEAPRTWLLYPEERAGSRTAARLFRAMERDLAEGLRRAAALGVDAVLLPTRSPTYQLIRPELDRSSVGPAFENDGVVILPVGGTAT
jgi:hypothetical protein